jgi:NDP-4-keto-2,6-dideoxyhexose 3-C-methyltransferase
VPRLRVDGPDPRPVPRRQVIAGSFGISKDFPPIARRIPLELVRCDIARDQDACGLVQLRHTVPGDLMYAAYGYRSGLNEAMAAHLAELARDMERRVRLRAGDLVVDIGANDGTLLAAYTVGDVLLYGFEPSDVEPERPLPRVHFIHDYFSARSLRARIPAAQARIVTSIAMFYDLDDPNSFVADVAAILAPDGLWAIELSYLRACWPRTRSTRSATSTWSTTRSGRSSGSCRATAWRSPTCR